MSGGVGGGDAEVATGPTASAVPVSGGLGLVSGGLNARLRLARPGFNLDVALSAEAGQTIVLLGPNGSGKSTTLRCLAGLTVAQEQRVEIGGTIVADTAAGIDLPPEQRRVGFVFQDYLLFPHMSVLDNVAFGPRARGVARAEAADQAREWLARLDVAHLAERRPGDLSGGQAQRVALARALVTAPQLLLLDEPLAALDAATRAEVRSTLRQHLSEFAGVAVMVTHDPLDAMVLGDEVVVLEGGSVAQAGTPADIARRPATEYVAALMGVNLLRGVAERGEVQVAGGGVLRVADSTLTGPVIVAVRPEVVSVHLAEPKGSSPRNVWSATVTGLEVRGDLVRLSTAGPPSLQVTVTPAAVAELGLREGAQVWLSAKASELVAYPG